MSFTFLRQLQVNAKQKESLPDSAAKRVHVYTISDEMDINTVNSNLIVFCSRRSLVDELKKCVLLRNIAEGVGPAGVQRIHIFSNNCRRSTPS